MTEEFSDFFITIRGFSFRIALMVDATESELDSARLKGKMVSALLGSPPI